MSEEIYFKSAEHKERFSEIVSTSTRYLADGYLDREYGSAFYILTCDYHLWDQAQVYFLPHGIDFEKMQNSVLSDGYHVLVDLAGNLFNESIRVNIAELWRLDDDNLKVAMQSLRLRFYTCQFSVDDD
jgi:hypothetical protein